MKEGKIIPMNPSGEIGYMEVAQVETEWMDMATFLSYPPVFCQRQTDFRKPKTKKLLERKFFQSHLDVAIFEYPDGKRVRGNGNTRAVCWEEFEEEGLENLIPAYVNAIIYPVKDDDEAKALYYTFDSDQSVEKAPDKITGVFRALGLVFNTKKIAKGNIGKSLEFCSNGRESNSISNKKLDWFAIIKDFKEEIQALDKIRPKAHFDANIICAVLMMLKRHGTKNERLLEGLEQLNARRKGPQDPKTGTDGITRILEEWDTNRLFEHKGTDGTSMPRQQDFLICCFEKWMEKENINYRKPSEGRRTGKGRRKNAYDTFWDNED